MIHSLITTDEWARGPMRWHAGWWVALGALALGTSLGAGASPVDARPSTPASNTVGPSAAATASESVIARDLDAAERLTVLGEHYFAQRALGDAEDAFRRALTIVEAAVGPTDPRLVDSLTALADVRHERRDFTGAETLYRRVLAIVEMAYGPEDSRIAGPLANLAGLYRTWERWDDATPLYLRVAALFERVFGADDLHVALALTNVAEIHTARGCYADSEALYGRVLAILEPRLGSESPLVQRVRAEHARARRQLEDGAERKADYDD
jgi:tetratricopeptide (TPR) repeat protein